jgi:hypothetical protein
MSVVTQHDDLGAVVLETMSADGTLTNKTITRIPSSLTVKQSYSTIVATEIPDNVRLVINLVAQDLYSPYDVPNFRLPVVIDRREHTIPVCISSINQQRTGCIARSAQNHIKNSSVIRYGGEESIAKRPRIG